jgi:penicillin-binding protein 1A
MADDSRPPSSSGEYRRDPGRGASQGASGSGEGSGGGGNYSDEELERYFNDPRRREGPGAERSGSAGGSGSGFSEASASASSGEEYAPPGSRSSSGGGGDALTPGGGAGPPGASGGGKGSGGGNGNGGDTPWSHRQRPRRGLRGFFHRRLGPKKAQAAFVVSLVAGAALLGVLALGGYFAWQITSDNLPSTKQIENPELDQATVAYTTDGKVLARYATQNRSMVTFDELSEPLVEALVATEDHRFYEHWGMDVYRTIGAVGRTVGAKLFGVGDVQGGSTITQQLARNLYNKQIGYERTVERKVKEMITAMQIERQYTKQEIIAMYLNTIEFGNNAFGIEAAAQTYFDTTATELGPLPAATLVGMLKAPSRYDPLDGSGRAKARRNVVLAQMRKRGVLSDQFYTDHKDDPVETDFQSNELAASLAPYFAEFVRGWMKEWAQKNDRDFYTGGLRVYTTLDATMQKMATAAVEKQADGLQNVVDYEWSRASNYKLGEDLEAYADADPEEPFSYFWETHPEVVNDHVRGTQRYAKLTGEEGLGEEEALEQLKNNAAFADSLRRDLSHLSAGLVSLNPRNGYVKTWVGGRNFEEGKYDHVALAQRQPGSTFKPFVYTAAIDNGYSPFYTVQDSVFTYTMEGATEENKKWSPTNFSGSTGQMKTLREGLANSLNTITARVMMKLVNPSVVAKYAHNMGIKSDLKEVPALALGAGEVTLLEMAAAYSTLANGGLSHKPQVVTRIEDRSGNVLYQAQPEPEEALPQETAFTVVDMMRDVIDYGTGSRINWQWELGDYDLAGKTGTTTENADGWFMLMHPQLVTGAWVGFNDRRVAFRSTFWGQGAHNALFLVGDYFQRLSRAENVDLSKSKEFPLPTNYGESQTLGGGQGPGDGPDGDDGGGGQDDDDGRVGW